VDGNLEVLMVRRSDRADFVGGAHVFPGGGVDPTDDAVATSDSGPPAAWGRSDAEASRLLGLERGGLAYWVAALRECFEEAGILLAYRSGAGPPIMDPRGQPEALVSFARPDVREHFDRLRTAVNGGDLAFLEMCRREQLVLALDRVHYFAHWVTPEGAPRRYDTRFFVALAPEGQIPRRDEHEIVDEVWIRPSDALRQHREGHIDLVLPTVRCLAALSRFSSAGDLVDAVRDAPLEPGRRGLVAGLEPQGPDVEELGGPLMVRDVHGRRVTLPGDPPVASEKAGDGRDQGDGRNAPGYRPGPART
jgi:8-oxo-dGTP pyrophosphatase MutT (NUDIX family)